MVVEKDGEVADQGSELLMGGEDIYKSESAGVQETVSPSKTGVISGWVEPSGWANDCILGKDCESMTGLSARAYG